MPYLVSAACLDPLMRAITIRYPQSASPKSIHTTALPTSGVWHRPVVPMVPQTRLKAHRATGQMA